MHMRTFTFALKVLCDIYLGFDFFRLLHRVGAAVWALREVLEHRRDEPVFGFCVHTHKALQRSALDF